MAASLRTRLTLILVLANVVVLGALGVWLAKDEQLLEERRRQLPPRIQQQVSARLSREPQASEDIAEILSWNLWGAFEEALIIDDRVLQVGQQVVPVGAFLNPNGSRRRRPDLPLDEIKAAMNRAAVSTQATTVAGGAALPLIATDGQTEEASVWGGVYLRLVELPAPTPFAARVVLAAGIVTLLGAGAIYLLVGRTVVSPVERLASAAHEFGEGGDPRLPRGEHASEVEELVSAFASMMERIRGFQGELKSEVEAATERAGEAERQAARQGRLAAMGTLAAGLAHEINSPLAGALQGLETLRKEARSERAQRHGDLTGEALERIGTLVRRLLRLAPIQVEAGSCTIQEVVQDLRVFLHSRLDRHRLEIVLPEEPLRVSGAPGDLFPVLLNLTQNALDALDSVEPRRAGTVRIEAGAEAGLGRAVVMVRDDGPGASEDLLPHLFEPFVTDKEVGHGTGLGLALAHATVRQLGGGIEARNLDEGGLEVCLLLPLAGADAGEPAG